MTARPDLAPLRRFAKDSSLGCEAAEALAAAWIYRGKGPEPGPFEQLEAYSALGPESAVLLGTHLVEWLPPREVRRLNTNLIRWATEET